ncbi:MAG TPA: FAD-dependent monooxygenase [Actinoplanes sp.]|nr:FAD-dependent monooxygenase [Actinoplanes sp.]
MTPRIVLISGAGVAGPTLAYWLARRGFRPTVVERAQGLRSSGSPVDVRGPAVAVADAMGIMPRLRAAATSATTLTFLGAGSLPMQRAGSGAVELPRGDLASILWQAARDDAEFLFDDTITTLTQDGSGVDVTFDRAAPRRFDLVVGADGLHSLTRRLAFGPESDFIRHGGVYVATVALGRPLERADAVLMYNTPGRAVTLHPSRTEALAAFLFRSPVIDGFDHRDTAQHKRLLIAAFDGAGWIVPELLDRVRAADDLYFDAVSQVRMSGWSRGRVTLLGDAASSLSLFGEGSSLAMSGAATLARALARHTSDVDTALRTYEAEHRKLVVSKQRYAGFAAALLVPRTRAGLTTRDLGVRLAGRLRREKAPCPSYPGASAGVGAAR